MSRLELANTLIKAGFPIVEEDESLTSTVDRLIRVINAIEEGKQLNSFDDLVDIRETPDITLSQAINVVVEHLRTNDDYYKGWKDNISMAFKDAVEVKYFQETDKNMEEDARELLDSVANNGAERFLKSFML